jgi:hypothetical protein
MRKGEWRNQTSDCRCQEALFKKGFSGIASRAFARVSKQPKAGFAQGKSYT